MAFRVETSESDLTANGGSEILLRGSTELSGHAALATDAESKINISGRVTLSEFSRINTFGQTTVDGATIGMLDSSGIIIGPLRVQEHGDIPDWRYGGDEGPP